MKFEISKSMENKINNWDKCEPKDVTEQSLRTYLYQQV
jgi:hypothetical protein